MLLNTADVPELQEFSLLKIKMYAAGKIEW
jgi:hypothetical protein